jgi:signal transduction histidine kinase
MIQLLDNLLVIGKAEADKLEFNPAPLNLIKFCNNLVEELQLNAGSKHSLGKDAHPQGMADVPKIIVFTSRGDCTNACMDENLLRQILTNLLSNAIKYSPKGEIVTFELSCQDKVAIFRIQDRGIGISLEDQEQLFEPFYRAANVGTIKGTGLGLSIVKKCVDLHNSHIFVESEVGVGTTFTVTLPLVNC